MMKINNNKNGVNKMKINNKNNDSNNEGVK